MPEPQRWRRWLPGLLVSTACLALLWPHLDLAAFGSAIKRLDAGTVLLALVLLAAGYALRILRWRQLLAPLNAGVSVRHVAAPFLACMAVNNLVPLRAGDALRVVGFQRRIPVPAAAVLGTLICERLLDLLAVLALANLALLALTAPVLPPWLASALAVATAAGLVGLAIVLVAAPHLANRLQGHPGRLAQHASGMLLALAPLRKPLPALVLAGLTAAAWLLEAGVFVVVANAVVLGGEPAAPWLGAATGTLGTLLPGAPGHVGTFDAMAAAGAGIGGAAAASAATWALLVHLLLWLPVTLAGVLAMLLADLWPDRAAHG